MLLRLLVTLEARMKFAEGGFDARFWLLVGSTFLGFLGMGTVLPALGPHVSTTCEDRIKWSAQ